jgi:hypothetical protein
MVFNGDRGFSAPGWHTGFGAIQIRDSNGGYNNSATGLHSIIYIAPDGTRHDLALRKHLKTLTPNNMLWLCAEV